MYCSPCCPLRSTLHPPPGSGDWLRRIRRVENCSQKKVLSQLHHLRFQALDSAGGDILTVHKPETTCQETGLAVSAAKAFVFFQESPQKLSNQTSSEFHAELQCPIPAPGHARQKVVFCVFHASIKTLQFAATDFFQAVEFFGALFREMESDTRQSAPAVGSASSKPQWLWPSPRPAGRSRCYSRWRWMRRGRRVR